jgi:hypothetical protein
MTPPRSEGFMLPRLAPSTRVDDTSFYREAASRLGFYEPGERPSIVDPTWTANRAAQATVAHEQVHQQLTINTHHGLLTQFLIVLARDGLANASRRACLDEQWSVQELAATYSELAFVRRTMPAEYAASVRGLPTAMLDQPPYRELYERAEELLPVDVELATAERVTRDLLVLALTGCAMQTGCLRVFVALPFDDEAFASYLHRESPHRRFEEVVTTIGAAELQAMARDAAAQFAGDADMQLVMRVIAEFAHDITRRVRNVPIEDAATLAKQAQAAKTMMEVIRSGTPVEIRPEGLRQRPEFVDSPEKRKRIRELLPYNAVDTRALDEWLRRCEQLGGDVHLLVGGAGLQGTPFAAVCILPPGAPEQLDDLRGSIDPPRLLSSLEPFAKVPLAITFAAGAWLEWYQLFSEIPRSSWVHARMMRAVRICAHRKLSHELVAQLLEFEDLKQDAGVVLMQVSPELFVGCFASPSNVGAYALQKIPSRAALAEFEEIVNALQVPMIEPAGVPHLELLKRIVRREFVDPQDL